MRGLLFTTTCVVVFVVAGCGGGDDPGAADESGGRAQARTELPSECRLGAAERLLTGFIAAVDSGDRRAVARYVAPQPELYRLTLYAGPGPGEGALNPSAPAQVYEAMAKLTRGEVFALVGAGVGIAPLVSERSGQKADDPAAGADFVYESERRSISGKVGFNCATGQIYVGAMGVKPGPGSRVFCGRRLEPGARRPVVCAYDY